MRKGDTLRVKLVAAAVAIIAAFAVSATPAISADKDCSDFNTWRQAQNFYKRHGGPKYDPHRLDADRDGIACESLRY
jgi:Excalibur calcium-binding domain